MKYKFIKPANPKMLVNKWREPEIRSKDKSSVIILGCSFANGFGLEDSQTMSRKLADYSGRTVYNYAVSANGINYAYWLFENNVISKMVKNPDYIIYVYIDDHVFRSINSRVGILNDRLNLKYKIINGKLKEEKRFFPLLESTFTVQLIHLNIESQIFEKDIISEIYMYTLSETVKKAKEQYPGAKFVILNYCDKSLNDEVLKKLHELMTDKFKENQYTVITTEELTGKIFEEDKYFAEDKYHPSEAAWDEIVPPLVKKLKLDTE